MVTTGLLFALLLAATYTDVRWRKVPNKITYPGIVLGLLLNLGATMSGWMLTTDIDRPPVDSTSQASQAIVTSNSQATRDEIHHWLGAVGLQDSLTGLAVCGGMMLVCYVFFPGGIGGGDIKLVAMMGTFLGLRPGMEAMLWTFVLGGCLALAYLAWKPGVIVICSSIFRYLRACLKSRSVLPLTTQEREPLRADLFLCPSALVAAAIVRWQLISV